MKVFNALINYKLIIFSVILTISCLVKGQENKYQDYYSITSQNSRGISIAFEFDKLLINNARTKSSRLRTFEIPGLPYNYVDGRPLLPLLTIPLTLPEGKISVNVIIESVESYPGYFPVNFKDEPNQADKIRQTTPQKKANFAKAKIFSGAFPQQVFELEKIGLFRDYQLSILRIYPLQTTGNGVTFNKKFTVNISYNNVVLPQKAMPVAESNLLNKFVANNKQFNLVSPKGSSFTPVSTTSAFLQNGSNYDSRIKLIVDKNGIYQVTGTELEIAGIELSSIDPRTFRLTNKGGEVAYFLTGAQDGQFDQGDYFEFWGERNEQTFVKQYPDVYSDPFSDENVYWMEWGANPGLRMVEENGSIVKTQAGTFNPSFFYSSTIHVEKNRQFERLGQANQEQLSYKRDLWFFDSGIRAIGKTQYPFELIYPDETSFNPVLVEIMLSGKTFGANYYGSPVPHNVMAWVNNGFVGSSAPDWFSQDTSRISNVNNSSLRTTDLQNGENILEIQLPLLPDVTVQAFDSLGNPVTIQTKGTDIVLLNWFNITYDRLYKASNNAIEFKRPSFIPFPNTDLFQFDIDGFTKPEIEVYKKGISRIVNFGIEVVQTLEGTSYRISLQDNVMTNDVEFIALTQDQKLKPLRIEKDYPFDPENPQRLLKDPNNAAEYLMITHNRFYDGAVQLRDYRRGQGVLVDLITVQDIYDEFNYGVKSPLAIQDFLRYVFFNWNRNHRLKYVLLLGDANFDYKTKNAVSQDFVPTFFYQTEKFGAIATDFPYALIAGEDQVPDLFIGRIPTQTNTDVDVSISKIIEYETSSPVNEWRNKALFISGNDKGTFEIPFALPVNSPAFRSQNSRIMESLVPKHVSTIRLNTVRDSQLPPNVFDPNYGSSTDLKDHFQDGLFWINFMGHGGGGIWADVELMNLSDVDYLTNQGMYPFVTSMTCFTGAFENPGNFGLAQKLLLAEDKGAIGVFASSGLGYLHNDYALMWNIGRFLFDRSLTIGEAITLGKILYWGNGQGSGAGQTYLTINGITINTPGYGQVRNEMVHQYNLIGEPYLHLQFTKEDLTLSPNTFTPQRGETIQIDIASSLSLANGYLELVDQSLNLVDRVPLFGIAQTETVSLKIPEDFREGTGVVRLYLSDNISDAAGEFSIGVNHAVLKNLEVIPASPGVDDTVLVDFNVEDLYGIKKVFLFREGNPDTIFAVEKTNFPNIFTARFEPAFQLKTVNFTLLIENNIGNISSFKNLSYKITDIRPDISIISKSLEFTGHKKTQLKVGLKNIAGAGIDDKVKVNVSFFEGIRNYRAGLNFVVGQVELGPVDSTSITVDFSLNYTKPVYDIYVLAEVDSLEDVEDFNTNNNFDSKSLLRTIFDVSPEIGLDTVVVGENYAVFFPPGSVSDSTAVRIAIQEYPLPQGQTGLKPISTLETGKFHAVEVQTLNPKAQINIPFNLAVKLNPAYIDSAVYSIEEVALYERINPTQPWTSTTNFASGAEKLISANLIKNALFAPFISRDISAPLIELTVDGRPVQKSGLVSTNPTLYLIVQDESGVNLQKDKIEILVDGSPLPKNQVFIPDSLQNNNVLGISIYPELSEGRHLLGVKAQDVNGNSSEQNFELVVRNGFDIQVYGNYPNPFKDQTIFSYFVELSNDLDKFEIRIYTVSGHMIKRIDSDINNGLSDPDGGARRKGYNELIWDGTDQDGIEVANGLYFAVLRGTFEGDTIEKTLKVAKLR